MLLRLGFTRPRQVLVVQRKVHEHPHPLGHVPHLGVEQDERPRSAAELRQDLHPFAVLQLLVRLKR